MKKITALVFVIMVAVPVAVVAWGAPLPPLSGPSPHLPPSEEKECEGALCGVAFPSFGIEELLVRSDGEPLCPKKWAVEEAFKLIPEIHQEDTAFLALDLFGLGTKAEAKLDIAGRCYYYSSSMGVIDVYGLAKTLGFKYIVVSSTFTGGVRSEIADFIMVTALRDEAVTTKAVVGKGAAGKEVIFRTYLVFRILDWHIEELGHEIPITSVEGK